MKHLTRALCLTVGLSTTYGATASDSSLISQSGDPSHMPSPSVTLADLHYISIECLSQYLSSADIRSLSMVNKRLHQNACHILNVLDEWRINVLKTIFTSGVSTTDTHRFRSIGITDIAEGPLTFKDAVSILLNPKFIPRTEDELREMSPRESIENQGGLSPDEQRALLGLLPDATIIHRLSAIDYLERTGEIERSVQLYRKIVDTSSTDRIEYLKPFLGFEKALRLFMEEGYSVAPLDAASRLERLVSHKDIVQIYQTLQASDHPIVQEAATDRLQTLLEA